MNGLFSYDGKLARAISRVADVIIMSLLWIVCCVPLVTVCASTTALNYAAIKASLKEGSVAKNFFKSFKENFRQSLLLTLIFAIVAAVMAVNWKLIMTNGAGGAVMKVIYIAALIWLALILAYIFPLLSRFSLPTGQLFVNAFMLSVTNLPKTIFILLTDLLPVVTLVMRVDYVIRLLPLIITVVPGLIASLNALQFIKIFDKYSPGDSDKGLRPRS